MQMTLNGVDIYIWSAVTPDVPKTHGKFTLKLISNRGTRIYPPPVPEIDLLDWPRCRYVSDETLSDADIDEMVEKITSLGFTWSKCQKLYRDVENNVNLYSEPY